MESVETSQRGALVCKDVKYGVELRDLKKIFDFLGQVQQLQVPALILHGRKPADQFADSRTVDVVHVREIQKDFFSLVLQQPANGLSQQSAAVAKRDLPAQVHNGDLPGIAVRRM